MLNKMEEYSKVVKIDNAMMKLRDEMMLIGDPNACIINAAYADLPNESKVRLYDIIAAM